MSAYRAKPILIEAYRFDPSSLGRELPPGICGTPAPGADNWDYEGARFWINTAGCRLPVSPGDWIVTEDGVDLPVSHAAFAKCYEPVDPHEGWTPLVEGCAMPEHEQRVILSVNHTVPIGIDTKLATAFTKEALVFWSLGTRYAAPDFADEWGWRVTAWRPAPAPWRGAK